MKLATIDHGTPDGRLVIVSRDYARALLVPDIARTLQQALEAWTKAEPMLRDRFDALEAGTVEGRAAVRSDAGGRAFCRTHGSGSTARRLRATAC